MQPLRRMGAWLSDRLALRHLTESMGHEVPRGTATGPSGWMYVLGFTALALLLLQVVSGIALATRYVPAAGSAYESVRLITEETGSGRLIRGMHFWGATGLVAFVLVHMARVFLTGSFKFPREGTWLTGVGLLVLVLAMAFTGQLLRWDQDGLWGVVVASQYAGRVPFVGDALKRLILAGDFLGGATLGRFFALHVIAMPLLLLGLAGYHLFLVQHHGISEPPRAGEPVEKDGYRRHYRELLEREGVQHFPWAAWREVVAAAAAVVAVVLLGALVGARELGEPPDPASVPRQPRPDWFLMWYYALIAVKPRGLEDLTMVYLPIVALAVLLLVPIVAPAGERAPSRRPWAVGSVAVLVLVFGALTAIGYRGPWVPDLESEPLTAAELPAASPAALEGARTFHAEGCQACHTVLGRGGAWGPELTDVLARMSPARVSERVLNGIGDMPPYRGSLPGAELEAILAFLQVVDEERGP
ncbi:MAG: cytochrome b N-terminal domain-containing protein [Gemmatimonadetes bacterium]|nr:cytochrome b N-terminal domain-containing protein [Gemmatimonadota bacterium]